MAYSAANSTPVTTTAPISIRMASSTPTNNSPPVPVYSNRSPWNRVRDHR